MSVDSPQVVVAPGGALTYNPSNFTASNGTSVTFVFSQYGVLNVIFTIMLAQTAFLGTLHIPSHKPRSKIPARIWGVATARLVVSILAYNRGRSIPSRSQMIKSVSPSPSLPFHLFDFCATAIFFYCKSTQMCPSGMVG